ncbi:PilZ domain-containing protein [Dongshaea marina]|uniref:PilZ domain-containing protein n=1 Tax=Dongshaea marina TaxID=2047966 RepID=UPI000D3E6ECB|nr:PilZ domain-containing protein [Dongshaea marina]
MELKEYKGLVDQLIPLLSSPDFDDHFDQLTEDESNHTRFLLKMELSRLSTPCRRFIDLRDKVNGECFPYEFQGICHFMDDLGISIFESQLKRFGGNYTIGVYETVLDLEFREDLIEQHQDAESSPASSSSTSIYRYFDVKNIPFSSYHGRKEERIHYTSSLMLRFANDERLYAKSSDLSAGGLRIQVPHVPDYDPQEEIEVFFTGLEREQGLPLLHRGILFKILGSDSKGDRHWLRLIRTDDDIEFDQFINEFIDSNKRKYRVSVDYLLSAATIKGYEQFYIPRMTGIPLLFDQSSPPKLTHALRTENNQQSLEYWRNEKDEQVLAGALNPERLTKLLSSGPLSKETLIYCFTHSLKSRLFFYAATHDELTETGLRDLFFHTGAKRPSWRVFRFSLESVKTEDAFTLNNFLLEEQELEQCQNLVEKKLQTIGHIGFLQDITDNNHKDDFLSVPEPKADANQLQKFGVSYPAPEFETEIFNYIQLRKESRYLHKTQVQLTINNELFEGWTRDISFQGLQLEFDGQVPCENGDNIKLGFPKLQALTQAMKLSNIAYQVVGTNPTHTILHLCAEGDLTQHVGYRFFRKLIINNQNKLKQSRQKQDPGMATAIRNIYTHHLFTYPFYVNKLKVKPYLSAIATAPRERSLSELLRICAQQAPYNLFPLLNGQILHEKLFLPLKVMHRESPPRETEIFISLKLGSGIEKPTFDTRIEQDFNNSDEKRSFITQALMQGGFYSVRLIFSRTGRPDIQYINNELDYVAQYAIHKAKQLEEELWCVIGVADLIDTTQATLFRFGLSEKKATKLQ